MLYGYRTTLAVACLRGCGWETPRTYIFDLSATDWRELVGRLPPNYFIRENAHLISTKHQRNIYYLFTTLKHICRHTQISRDLVVRNLGIDFVVPNIQYVIYHRLIENIDVPKFRVILSYIFVKSTDYMFCVTNKGMLLFVGLITHYNMAVWILAVKGINFPIAAGSIRFTCPVSSNLVCN